MLQPLRLASHWWPLVTQVISSDGHKLIFASLWNRDRALKALRDAWAASGSSAAKLVLQSDDAHADTGAAVPQRSEAVRPTQPHKLAAPSTPDRADAAPQRSEHARGTHGAHDAALDESSSASASSHGQGLLEAASRAPEPLLSPPAPILSPDAAATPLPDLLPAACAAAAPQPAPRDYALLPVAQDRIGTEALLECSATEFFALFLADGSRFTEAFRSARGERDIKARSRGFACSLQCCARRGASRRTPTAGSPDLCHALPPQVSPWSDSSDAGAACTRTVTFRAPLDAMKGSFHIPGIPKTTRIKEEQRCGAAALHDVRPALTCCAASRKVLVPRLLRRRLRAAAHRARVHVRTARHPIRRGSYLAALRFAAVIWLPLVVLMPSSGSLRAGDSFLLDVRLELHTVSESPARCGAQVHFRVHWLHTPRLAPIRKKIEAQSKASTADAFRMCAHSSCVVQLLRRCLQRDSAGSLGRAGCWRWLRAT
jgi:hypothetical protein